jgi:hypothetical protein
MKLFTNWKTALVTLIIFVVSMVFLPGFTAKALAVDTTPPSDTDTSATETDAARAAGATGGEAVFAGLSAGTLAVGAVIAAAGIAIIFALSSSGNETYNESYSGGGGGGTTSHH